MDPIIGIYNLDIRDLFTYILVIFMVNVGEVYQFSMDPSWDRQGEAGLRAGNGCWVGPG